MPTSNNYIAHSANDVVGAQLYQDHVFGVKSNAESRIQKLSPYLSTDDLDKLQKIVYPAIDYHDLGKLCPYSQNVLHGIQQGKMPNHVDAGVATLSNKNNLAAWAIHAHHRGYVNYPDRIENIRDDQQLKSRCDYLSATEHGNMRMEKYTDEILPILLKIQHEYINPSLDPLADKESSLFMRLALSILVSADHHDTCRNYGGKTIDEEFPLDAEKRLEKLDSYVEQLGKQNPHEIRSKVYQACRNAAQTGLVVCGSEVGTGKTTALMAYALNQAITHKKRKIIYVAPFCSIISQTVEIYRKLALTGNESLEIAEHHHQAEPDFDPDLDEKLYREYYNKYVTDWHSPIVCTTAVQFFETLAANRTRRLKKLHQMVGSVIIIDESHICIPPQLWATTLLMLYQLKQRFGCIIVFASGSMIKPWDNIFINQELKKYCKNIEINLESIIPEDLAKETCKRETQRVSIVSELQQGKCNLNRFCYLVSQRCYFGPKLIVCNTIKNAAMIAKELDIRGNVVYHLSTCLTPKDREETLEKVKNKLKSNSTDDWFLVATSCVEAGIDFSFQWGFRELSSVQSVLQLAGRINRNHEFKSFSSLSVFELKTGYFPTDFTENIEIANQQGTLVEFLKKNKVSPEFSNEAFDDLANKGFDWCKNGTNQLSWKALLEKEHKRQAEDVSKFYNVITGSKETVIINEHLLGDNPSTTELVRNSVQVYEDRLSEWPISPSTKIKGYHKWTGVYNTFLGYYAGLI